MLSLLATGADQLAIRQIQLLNEKEGLSVGIRCPLPFPAAIYAKSSSFGYQHAAEQTAEEQSAEQFMLDWVQKHPDDLFVVPTENLAPDDRMWERLRDDDDSRRRRYATSGAYIAMHCNVLVAFWDGQDVHGIGGTADHVRFKLGGRTMEGYPRFGPLGSAGLTGPVYAIGARGPMRRPRLQRERWTFGYREDQNCPRSRRAPKWRTGRH